MKWEHWLAIVFVLITLALGAMAGLNTVIGRQQAELADRAREIAGLEAQTAALEEQLLPPPYCEPLEGAQISSGCGYRTDPMGGGTEGLHKGVDLVELHGAPVRAVRAGVVVEHWPAPGGRYRGHPVYGGLVVIDHGDGLYSLYGHLSATSAHEGWRVEAGQVIGALGATGIATGPHLHFEVVTDPIRYLEGR